MGEVVASGDVLINKQSPTSTKDVPTEHGAPTYKAMPVSWKAPPGETCVVDKVLLTQNDDAHRVVKVPRPTLITSRVPGCALQARAPTSGKVVIRI